MSVLYVRASVSCASAEALFAAALRAGVLNPTPPGRLHCTVLYSDVEPAWIPAADGLYPLIATTLGFEVWDVDGKGRHLALLLDSPELSARHGALLSAGGAHRFPAYRPHVTLCKDLSEGFEPRRLFPAGSIEFSAFITQTDSKRRAP